ncbi:hypothetical protein [Actinomyces sp.]|nr:hypothetical protein [Actinomyces sp.]MDO4899434.1 hypothetical protein [Actinomyces sp.]
MPALVRQITYRLGHAALLRAHSLGNHLDWQWPVGGCQFGDDEPLL